ncbi:hypothetical protein VFC49_08325 [Thermococcus sp. SY098]|uniref:COG1470 family protein n=1 Tax=Thermococcus sp. SY098 TaxID=3111325 RepID=UPI002D788BB3|nr:hypothetical protein [Thermococcus sp. SY098]WRS52062.1 hypothetical protein VFC49_08325 [Thermococcus sp. SY098]
MKHWRESKNSIVSGDVSVGVKARFALTVRNNENAPRYSIPVRVYYVYTSPDGVWHSVIKVKEAEVDFDPFGEYQGWFDFTFANPGTYKFYLVVNGQEEDEKVIRVNSQEEIEAWISCEDSAELYKSFNCHVRVANLGDASVHARLVEIKFSRDVVWEGENWDSVKVSSLTGSETTVNPGETGTIEFTIWVDGELAKRIFGDGYYTYLFTPGGEPTAQWEAQSCKSMKT